MKFIFKCPKYSEPKSFSSKQNSASMMENDVEDYARCCAKKEENEVDTLSEWDISIASLVKRRFQKLLESLMRFELPKR